MEEQVEAARSDIVLSFLTLITITPWWKFMEKRYWKKQLRLFLQTGETEMVKPKL